LGEDVVDIPSIRLRAEIVIEFDAADFLEAASHQSRLAQAVTDLQGAYPGATLSIRERRPRGPKETQLRPGSRATGNLKRYS
jgi:hypothetical protein